MYQGSTGTANQEVQEFLFRPVFDTQSLITGINNAAAKIEELSRKVDADLARVVQMESYGIDRYSKKNQELYQQKLENIKKEERELQILSQSYNTMISQYEKYTSQLKAQNVYGIQESDKRINALKEEINLTERLGMARAKATADGVSGARNNNPYGIQGGTTTAGSTQRLSADMKTIIDSQDKVTESTKRLRLTWDDAWEHGSTFGHKVATTMQYMAAGAGIGLAAASVGGFISSIVEADKYLTMFQAILGDTREQALGLQKEIFRIGETYGGSTKELNETALALGRAGVEGNALKESIKGVSQIALLSGESLNTVTDVFVAWHTLYPKKPISDLADSLVAVSNASKISVGDLKTSSNYILSAGQQAGLTANGLMSMAAAWSQVGKAPSTIGTEGRRFFEQVLRGTDDVKKAYASLGVNVDKLKAQLALGGPEAEQALVKFYDILKGKTTGQIDTALRGVKNVLDVSTIQTNLAIANANVSYKNLLDTTGEIAKGSAEAAANKVALSYSTMWERIKNTLSEGSNTFANSFTKAFTDGGTTVGNFNRSLEEFNKTFQKVMEEAGVAASYLAKILKFLIENTNTLVLTYSTFKLSSYFLTVATSVSTVTGEIINMTKAQALFNAMVRLNPYVAIATGVVALGSAIYNAESNRQDTYNERISKQANKSFNVTYDQIRTLSVEEQKVKIGERISQLQDEIDRKSKRAETSASYKEIVDTLVKEKNFWESYKNKAKQQVEQTKKDVTKPPLPDLSGNPQLTGTDKSAEREARERAKSALAEQLANIKLAEQKYFLEKDITNEYAKQAYHTNRTLEDELAVIKAQSTGKTSAYANIEAKNAAIADKEREIKQGQNDLNAILVKNTREYEKQSISLDAQLEIIGVYDDKTKSNYELKNKILELDRKHLSTLKDLQSVTSKDPEVRKAVAQQIDQENTIYEKQKTILISINTEHTRQLDLATRIAARNIRTGTARMLEDQKAMSEYQKYSLDLTRQADDLQQELNDKQEKGLVLTDEDIAKQEKIIELRKRSDYMVYQGYQLQQAMQSTLNTSLMDFFNIQSQGWMNFQKLGMNVLNSIMQEMIRMSVVSPLSSFLSGGLGTLVSGLAGGFSGATGQVEASSVSSSFNWNSIPKMEANGGVNYLANGGSYVNSIVQKPTYVANGTVAGEAGAEGVLPLRRNAQGQLGVLAQGTDSSNSNIKVEIINNSSEELKITQSEAKNDMGEMVINIMIDAIARNKKGMRDIVKGSR